MLEIDPEQIECESLTDVGRVRSTNEDACGEFSDGVSFSLFVVADGMGGHRGGETASRLAVETIGSVFTSSQDRPDRRLRRAFETANERIFRLASDNAALARMGTTGVALLLSRDGLGWVAHVGDSRAYRLRAGRLRLLTEDHSAVGELQRRGLLTPEEAAVHPRRNELLRSIGVRKSVTVDLAPFQVEPGDRFLLCSDGLWGMVPDREIEAVLSCEGPVRGARMLVEMASAQGGTDNITAQVVMVPGTGRAAAPPATASSPEPSGSGGIPWRHQVTAWWPVAAVLLLGGLIAAALLLS